MVYDVVRRDVMETELNSDLLRGHIDTMILKQLLNQDCYGYEITKRLYEQSEHQFDLKEATLYSSIKRLEKMEAIESYWGDQGAGARRKYYRITKLGKQVFDDNLKAWGLLKSIMNLLVEDK